ncbi:MAG TPA: response regulator, partial [Candidatus Kapabacteria bacterium]|nr:response regulator [Candidatus Kapabacteria bacterium]
KQHNGWVNVYSERGKGTTFNIYFPSVISLDDEKIEEGLSLKELQGNREKILFIEDEEGVRKITAKALRHYGYNVVEAETAREALDIFKRDMKNISLVFSDIVLADKTGIELVDELRAIKPGLKILLTSGYADKKSRWTDVNEKGFPFLQKPYSLADLLRSVREVLM